MEARGWELLGIFHSHPAGPAIPSETDVRRAYYPDSLYLICAPDERGEWHARAFSIVSGAVEERELRVVSGEW
jgi:proteasome lid subunit RPN8/RPN11